MSLTLGQAPFGTRPAGTFNFDAPESVRYVEPFARRVRAVKDGETVVDSDAVKLVFETGKMLRFAFPAGDVHLEGATEAPLEGHVFVPWDAADAWFEEAEEVFMHPRDPYHRIDTLATDRQVRVLLDGVVLASSNRVKALYETSLPVRYYFPLADVEVEHLERSDTLTRCAYKGAATHWSARVGDRVVKDVAWSYADDVQPEAEAVRGYVCFYNERTDIEVDGAPAGRPQTAWSR